MKYSQGYTLIELMVTVSIAAILSSMALPSYRDYIQNESLLGGSNQLLGAMRYARSEAVKRKAPVKVCASNGLRQCAGVAESWINGWLVYVDQDNNDVVGQDDRLLKVMRPGNDNFTITPNQLNYESSVTFFPKGQVAIGARFDFCDERGQAFSRSLSLSMSGRAKVQARGSATCS